MRSILCLAVVAAAVAITGCATPYQADGLAGGFAETQLSPNAYRVTFTGNGFTRAEMAADMALLRSAELMLQKGFPFFVVMDGSSRMNYQTITSPVRANTTGTVDSYTNTFRAHTTFSGGNTTMIQSPTTTTVVMGFKEKPDERGMVYESRQVFDSLAPKYKKP